MNKGDFFKALGIGALAVLGAAGKVLEEERRVEKEKVESFGILPLDWYDLRRLEGQYMKIEINKRNEAEYFKGTSRIGWSLDKKFKPNNDLPEFEIIELCGTVNINQTMNAQLITKSGIRMTGTVMIIRA